MSTAGEEVPPPLTWPQIADLVRWISGAPREVGVEGLTKRVAGEGAPSPPLAESIRQTSGASQKREVEGLARETAGKEVSPSKSWAQVAGLAKRTSEASGKTGVEGLARKTAREDVTPSSRGTQVKEQTVQVRPVGSSTEVPLRREQLEDEGLTVVIRAMESGREPDE